MKSPLMFLARMLMVEQRYQAVKKSPKFIHDDPGSVKSRLNNFILVSYTANSISFAVFSFLLISPYLFQKNTALLVANMGFIVYIYALIISIYSSALFFNAVSSMKLLEPTTWLPYQGKKRAVLLSWFMYSGSTNMFVILPPIIYSAYLTGNYSLVPFGILWGLVFILLGYSVGAILNVFIAGRGRSQKAGMINTLKSTMRVMLMLLVFAVFEVGIYLPGIIPNLLLSIPYPLDFLLPVVNVQYTVFLGSGTLNAFLTDTVATILYLFMALLITFRSNSFVIDKTLEGNGNSILFETEKSLKFRKEGLVRSLLIKDARIVARKSQNVILLFIPVIFVFPTILSVLIYGSPGGVGNTGTYFSLISILIICSSFYSLILVVSEGNGIETLLSLPLSEKDIIYSKTIFGLVIFSVIIIPVAILITGNSQRFSPFDILVPANLILGYTFSSTFNLKRLMSRLPRESTTVNFYSFGGGLFLITMFLITAVIAVSPVLASALLTGIIYHSFLSNQYAFYLLDSVMNFVALISVILAVEKGSRIS